MRKTFGFTKVRINDMTRPDQITRWIEIDLPDGVTVADVEISGGFMTVGWFTTSALSEGSDQEKEGTE